MFTFLSEHIMLERMKVTEPHYEAWEDPGKEVEMSQKTCPARDIAGILMLRE